MGRSYTGSPTQTDKTGPQKNKRLGKPGRSAGRLGLSGGINLSGRVLTRPDTYSGKGCFYRLEAPGPTATVKTNDNPSDAAIAIKYQLIRAKMPDNMNVGLEIETLMTWKEATIEALTRMSLRHQRNFFTRVEIIDEELENIISDVGSRGATPAQTLSRVIQELRDEGYLDFDGRGGYTLLDSTSVPKSSDIPEEYIFPDRAPTTIHRIIRDPNIVSELKRLYSFRCQICQTRIELPSGYYCEAHHLKPLGMPHNGPDVKSNIIVVCPNHHVMLDYGAITLNKELLRLNNHMISNEYIEYHKSKIYHGPTNTD